MKLSELDADETLALVALCRTIVLSDEVVTEEEAEAVPAVIDAVGVQTYHQAFATARERFGDDVAALQSFLAGVGRPEARALIFETAVKLAKKDGVAPQERALLERLANLWSLPARI
jgi:uncharacterized tellurite resistance protein B-like protein